MTQAQYGVVRSNHWSAKAWGVVGTAGDLVANDSDSLRMRRSEAARLARTLNAQTGSTHAGDDAGFTETPEPRARAH
ncbi:hypothetical protein [Methylopila sp. M107]|uniref:hypothetical protein n=1 Tax=Methylopila sp. M107 TaxID=1101190 RepID=UPI0003629403|nr:hypothetical protein [Methylopila sp. M107]